MTAIRARAAGLLRGHVLPVAVTAAALGISVGVIMAVIDYPVPFVRTMGVLFLIDTFLFTVIIVFQSSIIKSLRGTVKSQDRIISLLKEENPRKKGSTTL